MIDLCANTQHYIYIISHYLFLIYIQKYNYAELMLGIIYSYMYLAAKYYCQDTADN